MLHDIGLDAEEYRRANEASDFDANKGGLGNAVFFDEETFGVDRLVVGEPEVGRIEGVDAMASEDAALGPGAK